MSEQPNQKLVDLFFDYFPNWKKQMEKTEYSKMNEILVKLKSGVTYRFGEKMNHEIYLETVKPSQE